MNREFADECVTRFAHLARAAARRLAPPRPVADEGEDDRYQESLLALWRAALRYDPARGPLEPYLSTKARHGVINARRLYSGRGRAGAVSEKRPPRPCLSLEQALARRHDGRALRVIDVLGEDDPGFAGVDLADSAERALRRLPAGTREAARLVYICGMRQKEAAAVIGVSESRVSQLLELLPAGVV